MRKNIASRRGGFTLVEIMIVVAIIALLAAIAVPSFLRARQRSQATATLETCRMVDAAKDQFAIENNKKKDDAVAGTDLQPYVKNKSKLWEELKAGNPKDALGADITIGTVDNPPAVSAATKAALDPALGTTAAAFWAPY